MKAAFIHQPGPSESIIIGDLPKPVVSDQSVLVRIGAVAVNPIDTYIRSGLVKVSLPQPYIIGSDLAGTVEAVGPKVTRFKVGDRVWGTNQGLNGRQGAFSEFAAVDEEWLYSTPHNTTDEEAAAIALVGITAALGLLQRAQLQVRETLFVNGGTGGVGSAVVQIAKALGGRVITTAGGAEKVIECQKLGADLALDYRIEDVDARIRIFAPQGINVWWETLREPNLERTLPLLATRGRVILMAGRDAKPVLPIGPFYVKDCALLGFAVFNAPAEEQRVCAERLNEWLAAGKVRARIDRVLRLDQAAEAHRLQEENTIGKKGTLAGKIVLRP